MRLPLHSVSAGDAGNARREEGEPRAASIGTRWYHCRVDILLCVPVLEEERENTAPGVRVISNVAEEGAKGFGSLIALLEKIPTVYADHKVRTQLLTWNDSWAHPSAGLGLPQEQGRSAPLTYYTT